MQRWCRCRGCAEVIQRGAEWCRVDQRWYRGVQRWCRSAEVVQKVQRWCRGGAKVVQRCRGAEVLSRSRGSAEVIVHLVIVQGQRWCRCGAVMGQSRCIGADAEVKRC